MIKKKIWIKLLNFSLASLNGYSKSHYELGLLYKNGIGIDKNYEEAIKLFKQAALKGHNASLKELASLGIVFDNNKMVENTIKDKNLSKKNVIIENGKFGPRFFAGTNKNFRISFGNGENKIFRVKNF